MNNHLVFDGHNDVLLRLYNKNKAGVEQDFITGDGEGHIDLPRMLKGGCAGGLFAIYIPSSGDLNVLDEMMKGVNFDVPFSAEIDCVDAMPIAMAMAAILRRIEGASQGAFKICTTAADIQSCLKSGTIAAVMHMEGAEAIDKDLDSLEVFYAAGLRSLGPVWSRPNIFGHGVPFRFPSTGDTGAGLTDLGKHLVRRCESMGIAIDLSHITEHGFWDVAKITSGPLIASHSNPFALCKSSRNLSDKQLDAIAERGGLVGVNFATCFLNADGQGHTTTTLETMIKHMDYLIAKLGVDHVAFGSDFDGAEVPDPIGDIAGLPNLIAAMKVHGYNAKVMAKITHENWISTLAKCWR